MKLVTVPLNKINLEERKFCLSPFVDYQEIIPSLKRFGLLLPPLIKKFNKSLILVSGWKRVMACQELKASEIPAFLASENLSDLELFTRSLEENLWKRPLSLAEKAEAVYKLKLFGLSENQIMAEYFPRLSLPEKKDYLNLLIRVAGNGCLALKKFLHQTELSLEALGIFFTFSPKEQETLIPFLQTMSLNRRREIIFYLHEISLREKQSMAEILQSKEVVAIFERAEFSLRQKGEALAKWCRRRRYPLIISWQDEFQKILKDLAWPEKVHLVYDPSFEDDQLTISFSFREPQEFSQLLEQMRQITHKPDFQRLFRRSL